MSNGTDTKTEAVMARAKQIANQAGEKLEAAPDAARERVREYPLATVGVAFGVGVLVGAMGWALLQPRPHAAQPHQRRPAEQEEAAQAVRRLDLRPSPRRGIDGAMYFRAPGCSVERTLRRALVVGFIAFGLATPALADNTADEADIAFRSATRRTRSATTRTRSPPTSSRTGWFRTGTCSTTSPAASRR